MAVAVVPVASVAVESRSVCFVSVAARCSADSSYSKRPDFELRYSDDISTAVSRPQLKGCYWPRVAFP